MPPSDNQPAPQQPEQNGWKPDEPLLPAHAQRRDKKSVLIALIVSAVLLLAAVGVGAWLIMQKSGGGGTSSQPGANVNTPRKASIHAPANLPEAYVKREQNVAGVQASYYYDSATYCGFTTTVMELNDRNGKAPKEAIITSTKAAETLGLKTTASADGPNYTLKSTDGKQDYTFNSLTLDQDVNVQGADFKKQKNIVAFKQFGNEVAAISISCKSETWDKKKAELEGFLKAFTIKAE